MKKQESNSFLRDGVTKNTSSEQTNDWKTVLIEIIIKILTLGFYHIEKHKKQ